MKIKSIIVDDEPYARKLLLEYCAKVDSLEVIGDFSNAMDAASFINKHEVDLIFLDIKMPDITGLGMLGTLQNPPQVIFTTAFAEYALDGFELDAIDYLLKPFDLARFLKAVNKAESHFIKTQPLGFHEEFLFIKEGRNTVRLNLKDIKFIQGQKDYVQFTTADRKVMSLMNMKDLEKDLSPKGFLRIHQSYLINTHHISSISLEKIRIDKQEFPVSQSYKYAVKEFLSAISK
ncbi:MAG: LytTR family transcriptional regulator DNA-binding domain-containing protein [Ekhidna sp.]|uniref:LytR/AlgR family response regulator transcription factor n=1 Tax=Ekhidna sp. TaxID=2608089 RepID=UPI0032EB9879